MQPDGKVCARSNQLDGESHVAAEPARHNSPLPIQLLSIKRMEADQLASHWCFGGGECIGHPQPQPRPIWLAEMGCTRGLAPGRASYQRWTRSVPPTPRLTSLGEAIWGWLPLEQARALPPRAPRRPPRPRTPAPPRALRRSARAATRVRRCIDPRRGRIDPAWLRPSLPLLEPLRPLQSFLRLRRRMPPKRSTERSTSCCTR